MTDTQPTNNTDTLNPKTQKALAPAVAQGLNLLPASCFARVKELALSELELIRFSEDEPIRDWTKEEAASNWAKAISLAFSAYLKPRKYSVVVWVDAGKVETHAPTKTEALNAMRKAMNRRPNVYGSISPHPATPAARSKHDAFMWEYITDEKGNVHEL